MVRYLTFDLPLQDLGFQWHVPDQCMDWEDRGDGLPRGAFPSHDQCWYVRALLTLCGSFDPLSLSPSLSLPPSFPLSFFLPPSLPLSFPPYLPGTGSVEIMFSYDKAKNVLTIRRPGINVMDDFTLTFYDGWILILLSFFLWQAVIHVAHAHNRRPCHTVLLHVLY